ncbi:hypothetical protein K2173_001707 [Erythroxylum novogranatense]|uniref:C2H2-type domain-containing protein n=1 Tax=Erythroxylum novogranatense TaxID=1862640 RepID=A0AAV8S510_9ROSI|nr:hypothetical protein K2173_001707 [Erythroxylum novogranatense]
MEINKPSIRKSEFVWSSSHVSKSYTCAFCRRGFSNAQALGGHMNIHRRDRAKLREASNENLLSLDISRSKNPPDVSEEKNLGFAESSQEKGHISKKPEVSLSAEDDATKRNKGGEELQQLRLFLDRKKTDGNEETINLGRASSKEEEVDLELRLGPEPHDTSTQSNSIREFF